MPRNKARLAAAVLTVAAAAGLAGTAVASSAQAATLGFVQVQQMYTAPDKTVPTAWKVTWSDALKACKQRYPRTVSVEMTDASFYGARPPFSVRAYWNCRDSG